MNVTKYFKFRQPYERTLRQIILELEFFLQEVAGVSVYSVQQRLKSFESASEKARRLDLPMGELHDIAGIRIVLATAAEAEVVARFFYRKADSKDLLIKFDRQIAKAARENYCRCIGKVQERSSIGDLWVLTTETGVVQTAYSSYHF